jgi:hypothetical protein
MVDDPSGEGQVYDTWWETDWHTISAGKTHNYSFKYSASSSPAAYSAAWPCSRGVMMVRGQSETYVTRTVCADL